MTDEPDEGNLQVRVCGGRAGQPVRLPGMYENGFLRDQQGIGRAGRIPGIKELVVPDLPYIQTS